MVENVEGRLATLEANGVQIMESLKEIKQTLHETNERRRLDWRVVSSFIVVGLSIFGSIAGTYAKLSVAEYRIEQLERGIHANEIPSSFTDNTRNTYAYSQDH